MFIDVTTLRDFTVLRMKLAGPAGALYARKDGGPGIAEVKKILDDQGKAFEAFKETVNQRDNELKKLGSADVLLEQKIATINGAIDKAAADFKKAGERLDQFETALKRSPKSA